MCNNTCYLGKKIYLIYVTFNEILKRKKSNKFKEFITKRNQYISR